MTRKDYKLIAECLCKARAANQGHTNLTYERIVENLCAELKRDNPSFNRDKFLKAIYTD